MQGITLLLHRSSSAATHSRMKAKLPYLIALLEVSSTSHMLTSAAHDLTQKRVTSRLAPAAQIAHRSQLSLKQPVWSVRGSRVVSLHTMGLICGIHAAILTSTSMWGIPVFNQVSRALFQYPVTSLIVRSREVSKPRDLCSTLSDCSGIWQAPGISTAEAPFKLQSDAIIQITNPAASRLHNFLR